MKYSVIHTYDAHPFNMYIRNIQKGFKTEDRHRETRTRRKFARLLICFLLLTGCASVDKTLPLAPKPPQMSGSNTQHENLVLPAGHGYSMMNDAIVDAANIDAIQPAAGGVLAVNTVPSIPSYCRVKDRFDRKAALAYEWDRNRLALDLDGIGLDGQVDAMRIEYKLRIQPEKNRKAACRYKSSWQGVIGSGYNELFKREGNTVWEEVDKFKEKAQPYIERFF